MEAFFSSQVGRDGLRSLVLGCLEEASQAACSRRVDVHIMTFSFTDASIAAFLKDAAAKRPKMSIRIIADWGQRSRHAGRQVDRLARAGLPNLLVRYKRDQPYVWDESNQALKWSYRASRGLLHHKTLGIFVDGAPWKLACGSYNWTAKAANSYENLLLFVTSDDGDTHELVQCVEREFEAMWCDGQVTLSPDEAQAHYLSILEEYRSDPGKAPQAVVGLAAGEDAALPLTDLEGLAGGGLGDRRIAGTTRLAIAFSSRSPHDTQADRGYSARNRERRFDLCKPSGKIKTVPLTLTTMALDTLARAGRGDTLKAALYALSSRVPEYGALLDAARRGVRIQILIDAGAGTHIVSQLRQARERENLPIEIRAGHRTMHQKYLVHPEGRTVLTGTANFSTDATQRHSEQRILIRDNPAITASFVADFDTIWARVAKSL